MSYPPRNPEADAARRARRWWRPNNPLSWLATGFAALTVAALGAAVGAWVGWQDAGDLPTDAQAIALATALAPGATVEHTERFDAVFGVDHPESTDPFIGSDDYRSGYVAVSLGLPSEGYAALNDRVQEELTRQGWQAHREPYGYVRFTRDDLALITYPVEECRPHKPEACGEEAYSLPYGGGLAIRFERAMPPAAAPWTALGWLAGLLLGWSAARGAAALLRRRSGPQAQAALGIGSVGFIPLLPATVVTTAAALASITDPAGFAEPVWGPYMWIILRLPANLGVLFLLAAVAVAVLAPPGKPAAADPPNPRPAGTAA